MLKTAGIAILIKTTKIEAPKSYKIERLDEFKLNPSATKSTKGHKNCFENEFKEFLESEQTASAIQKVSSAQKHLTKTKLGIFEKLGILLSFILIYCMMLRLHGNSISIIMNQKLT